MSFPESSWCLELQVLDFTTLPPSFCAVPKAAGKCPQQLGEKEQVGLLQAAPALSKEETQCKLKPALLQGEPNGEQVPVLP